MNLSNAIALASELFRDVKDRGGEPYILHCLHVMNQFSDPELKIIAVLHDIIEDTDFELDTLESFGYSSRVLQALDLLTHIPEMPYEDYIVRISYNADAIKVKLADLQHNMDITRLNKVNPKDLERLKKYHAAWVYLNSEIKLKDLK